MAKFADVEAYVAAAKPEARALLNDMLACLRAVAPEAEESIKWGSPAFTQGRILFTVAARKDHIGFFPTPAAIRAFETELAGVATTRASIKFPLGKPLPEALVRRIAAW